jgi:hypothetical protein
MTRKDYEMIAAVFKAFVDADNANIEHIRSAGLEPEEKDWTRFGRTLLIAARMNDALWNDNPKFNREIFKKACGI